MGKIYETFGDNAHEMTMELLEAIDAASMVDKRTRVALKPNLVLASRAEDGAVTHPGVLSGCIEYFFAHGVKDVSVIESSWVGDKTMRAMRAAGYDKVLKTYGVEFFDLKHDDTVRVDTPIGPLSICRRALEADFLVDLPVLKGHCQTRMTCAIKNLKGCIPDREKRRFHSMGLIRPIAALGAALKPRLVVVDSICGDLCFEEGGTPVQTNRMYAATDAVMADAYGCSLMGLSLDEVPYIELAESFGAGSTVWSESDIVQLRRPTAAQRYGAESRRLSSYTRGVHEDSACSACYAALVRALYETGRGKGQEIYIGQGWQDKQLTGLGIGRCCKGATECVMGCPPTAEAIAKHLR